MYSQSQMNKWKSIKIGYRSLPKKKTYIKKNKRGKERGKTCSKQAVYQ